MASINCQITVPSAQALTSWQQSGLKLVSTLQGRDVVLAIDLTGSVRLNDEGRLRLRQIIEDSLQPGDSVYVVPFASTVNPLNPLQNSITQSTAIRFTGNTKDIDRILEAVPLQSNATLQNTDIQLTESVVYQKLAQLNQCRLTQSETVKAQSVVWLTDAPLMTKSGISSQVWVETPANSPFRQQSSAESHDRQAWMDALPLAKRSQNIDNYQLSVVDVPPMVQEFCTPAPGGQQTCLVNPYLVSKLWLPGLLSVGLLALILVAGTYTVLNMKRLKRRWILSSQLEDDSDVQTHYLRNQQRIRIGTDIECPGAEVRGYLKRDKHRLYLEPIVNEDWPIFYQNRQVTSRQLLTGSHIRLNCPVRSRDCELVIQIKY